jgi:acetamidase/formamidase
MTRHQLGPSPSTTVDVFSRDLPPALTVDSGDTAGCRAWCAALALASPVLDLRVTQVANESWGVHALLAADTIS